MFLSLQTIANSKTAAAFSLVKHWIIFFGAANNLYKDDSNRPLRSSCSLFCINPGPSSRECFPPIFYREEILSTLEDRFQAFNTYISFKYQGQFHLNVRNKDRTSVQCFVDVVFHDNTCQLCDYCNVLHLST